MSNVLLFLVTFLVVFGSKLRFHCKPFAVTVLWLGVPSRPQTLVTRRSIWAVHFVFRDRFLANVQSVVITFWTKVSFKYYRLRGFSSEILLQENLSYQTKKEKSQVELIFPVKSDSFWFQSQDFVIFKV